MFALARMAQRFVISFFVYFVLFCFVLFLLCSNYAKLNKTKKSAIVWHPTKNNRNYNGTVSFVLWCIVEFSAVVVQNETSIMNEKKNKWWLTHTYTYEHQNVKTHSFTYVRCASLWFTSFACALFSKSCGPGCLMLFLFVAIYGCYFFHDFPTPKIVKPTMSQRASKCLRSIKLK